ncbi:hypothetical protein QE152_g31876 [Popillia japonica]|uniref:Uncharacterized protein n=1 Tax=Popillia japonica TaxID=7064 RepID=A0AAW1J0I2_POPJA
MTSDVLINLMNTAETPENNDNVAKEATEVELPQLDILYISFALQLNDLNIVQWNAQSAVAKRPQLEYMILKYNIHIAVLCETWYKPQQLISF